MRRGRSPRAALEKLGGSSRGPGESVKETARGVVMRLPGRWSAAAASFRTCDELREMPNELRLGLVMLTSV